MLSNIAYIINARLARVFSRAHHTVISLHLPGDRGRWEIVLGSSRPGCPLADIDIKEDYVCDIRKKLFGKKWRERR